MATLNELRAKRAEITQELKGLIEAADKRESKEFTKDEEARYNTLDVELETVKADISKTESMENKRAKVASEEDELRKAAPIGAPVFGKYRGVEADPNKEFASFGEFIHTVVRKSNDPRLDALYDTREQSVSDGAKGGFMVPKKFSSEILSIPPDMAAIRPRATVMPAGDPPDSELEMPVLNQGAAENMYGGMTVSWIGEGNTKPETDADLKTLTLKPHEVAGHVVATDKLLRNWSAASAYFTNLFRQCIVGTEETAFITGNGVAKPQGLVNAPGAIYRQRAGANAVAFADVTNMVARAKRGGSLVWLASQTIIPQLAAIVDANNNNLYVMNAAAGLPPTLMGIPIVFNDRMPALGSKGDLILADLSAYFIKDGSGPFVASSEHVFFRTNKTVIKTFWNVDARLWLTEPIPLEGATSNTVSPVVVLDVP